jgi:hypothetical protein
MEFDSREDPEKFIERFLNWLVIDFKDKFDTTKRVARLEVKMSFQFGAFATTEFPAGSGREVQHDVPGDAGIVGQVYYGDGSKQTVFQRFIAASPGACVNNLARNGRLIGVTPCTS